MGGREVIEGKGGSPLRVGSGETLGSVSPEPTSQSTTESAGTPGQEATEAPSVLDGLDDPFLTAHGVSLSRVDD